jgi:3-methyladenine DNA glycosylase/8-oxoguanine DNA glycosylase
VIDARMFLMSHLQRPDVVASRDLGTRPAVMLRYGLPELPAPAAVEQMPNRGGPTATLACLYLWQSLHATPA